MRRRAILVVVALSITACGPSVDKCARIVPVQGEGMMLTTAPDGRSPACRCQSEGVTIHTEMKRAGLFGWTRGRIWIEGAEVSEDQFTTALIEAKARKRTQEQIAIVKGVAKALYGAVKDAAKAIDDEMKK